ncbi:MAG: hypothetical protein RR461_02175 [Angelakisella sp.]
MKEGFSVLPMYFSALLKAENGKVMEVGMACISKTENKVTFKSEFVPLVKLGTVVEIVRILGATELERFVGQVYLSSRNLLQIVGVGDAVMEGARKLFDINTYLPAYLALSPNNSPNFSSRKAELIGGTIRYLSMDTVKLSAMPYIGEGQYLMVESEPPLELHSTVLRVEKRELLGRKAAILICSIVVLPKQDEKALHSYVTLLSKNEADVDLEATPPNLFFTNDGHS